MYTAAQHLDVSGPIATVVAGLLAGNITGLRLSEATLAPLRTFWSGLDELLNALLSVFVGFHVVLINPLQGIVPGVPRLVAIIAVLFARALTVLSIVSGLNTAGIIRADCFGLTQLLTLGGLHRIAYCGNLDIDLCCHKTERLSLIYVVTSQDS